MNGFNRLHTNLDVLIIFLHLYLKIDLDIIIKKEDVDGFLKVLHSVTPRYMLF